MSKDIIGIGSETKPPVLVMGEYPQWKRRMVRFLDLINKDLMKSIMEGPIVVVVDVEAVPATPTAPYLLAYTIAKPYELYTPEQKARAAVDERALALLTMALSNDMYARVDSLNSARDIWLEIEQQMQGGDKAMESKRESAMNAYEGFRSKDSETLTESYNRLNTYVNDLRRMGIEKNKYETNVKFLKNLNPEWQQVAVNLQMSQNLGQLGLHDLYSMMVQHEETITGKTTKSDSLALISRRQSNTQTTGSSSRRAVESDNEPTTDIETDESDEEIKRLQGTIAMFARDLKQLKISKENSKYRPQANRDDRYRPIERQDDRY